VDLEGLSSRIYEAAIVPAEWETFLDAATIEASAMGAALFTSGGKAQRSILTKGLVPIWRDFNTNGWSVSNPRLDKAMERPTTHFVRDTDILPPEVFQKHPFFTEFCAKWGMGEALGAFFQLPSESMFILNIERSKAAGPYSDQDVSNFNRLRADMGRAIDLTTRLAYQQYENTTSVLNAVGVAAAVIDHRERLLSANPLFEKLIPHIALDTNGRLRIASKAANALFKDALLRLAPEHWTGTLGSIAIPPVVDTHAGAVLHVLPIRGLAHDIVTGGACLIVVSTLDGTSLPAEQLLRNLFDLTAAEARVARALIASSGSYVAVAKSLDIGLETARTHAKAIYRKTGISGAAELIAMGGRMTRVQG